MYLTGIHKSYWIHLGSRPNVICQVLPPFSIDEKAQLAVSAALMNPPLPPKVQVAPLPPKQLVDHLRALESALEDAMQEEGVNKETYDQLFSRAEAAERRMREVEGRHEREMSSAGKAVAEAKVTDVHFGGDEMVTQGMVN